MLGIYEMSERNTPGVGRVLTAHGRRLDDVWQIREVCIAALGGGVYATRAR